ncbi:MAG: hypothetical protein WDN27_06710 [Candidatus Saccharibacteria bacterium]
MFLGFPLGAVEGKMPEVAKALADLPPTVFVHNEFDTVGSAEAVRAYLSAAEPPSYTLQVVPGNATHDYVDFKLMTTLALQKP